MNFIIRLLKNRIVVMSIVCVVLSVMLLLAGHHFGWQWEWRIIGVMSVIFLWVIFVMYQRLQAARSSSMIEDSIKAQAEQNLRSSRPDKREEIEQLKQQLTGAIDSLKKSKLAKGGSGKAALYALPWYMFIGPPGSGKTTVIENSGLEFPFSSGRIRGVGGTRNCDWFFSNSAILLDTAGRYTTEEEDREEWYAFLDMLKKNRKKKPINGVIIGVSISEILEADPDEVESHARIIRTRIDELIQRLGVRFPVYLVFTKCDLIKGFVEFFGEYTRSEREQVWGTTFQRDQMNDPDPAGLFENEFEKLYESLESLRLQRLSAPLNREERKSVYTFPVEFRSVKDNLTLFTGKLFQPNPYQENPLLRGFYFTSGTQEGVPIDRVIQSIAKEIGLSPESVASFDPEMETKSYFIKDLFTDIVIPDQNLGEQTSRMARQRGLAKVAAFTAIVIGLALFGFGMLSHHLSFKNDVSNLRVAAQRVDRITWSDESILEDFHMLDSYRNIITQLEDRPFLGLNVYRSSAVRDPARLLYFANLYPFVSRFIVDGVLTDLLTDYANGSDDIYRDQAYEYLRAYLLLGDKHHFITESEMEKNFLKQIMNLLTDNMLERRFRFASLSDQEAQTGAVEELVKRQIEYFVQIYADEDMVSLSQDREEIFTTDSELVSRVRDKLGSPDIQDVYSRIKREGTLESGPLTLHEILDGQNTGLFTANPSVPGFFTQKVWDSFVSDEIRTASRAPDRDDWVLGVEAEQFPPEMRDETVMEEHLREIYYEEYIDAWWDFLSDINVRRFTDLATASDRLKRLGDGRESPIRRIIETVKEETSFAGVLDRAVGDVAEQTGADTPRHPVDREFRTVHALYEDKDGDLMASLSQFDLLAGTMAMLDNDPPVKTAEFAAQVIQQRAGEIPEALNSMRSSLRGYDQTIRRNLFEQPVFHTWNIVLGRTQHYLNTQWQQRIHSYYQQTFAGNYPIDRNGTGEISLADFEQFFSRQGGIFWEFLEQELEPFIRLNTWSPITWEGRGITVSPQTRNAFDRVSDITSGLGLQNRGNISIEFSLIPDLPSPSGILEQIILSIDGKEMIYRMGRPRWEEVTWPGMQGSPRAFLEVQTYNRVIRPDTFEGRWGWFRLLDLAEIRKESSTNYRLRWYIPVGGDREVAVNYRLRTSSVHHPFGEEGFFELSIPSSLD